jgi:GTP-binding protein YchF
MGINCGIVGLPNVGKSTLFQAVTSTPAEAANYPFCTIEPNVGIVEVPDERLKKITEYIKPQKIVPAIVEFVDIAGLVRGASKGEGLGNQFLGHIRQVGAICHVVRCFDDGNIIHVEGGVDPKRDIETINLELCLADLESVEKRLANIDKFIKSNDKKVSEKAKIAKNVLANVAKCLGEGLPARSLNLEKEEAESIADLQLITMKKVLYVCNVDEDSLEKGNKYVDIVKQISAEDGSEVIMICGKLESEIAALSSLEERKEFMESVGLQESGLTKLIRAASKLLDLQTYFTAGEKEVRAWTFRKGAKAPECAGVIHSDFERGFIRAEVYHCTDLFEYKTEAKIKEAGKLRVEGKEYIAKDGDVMHFRFNV